MILARRVLLSTAFVFIVIILVHCGGSAVMKTDIYIPEPDRTQLADAHYAEGWKNLKAGKPQQATKNFEKSSVPEEKIWVAYGYANLSQNKLSTAKSNFEKCLAINPENFQAQLGLATIYEISKEYGQAFRIYSRLRASNPDDSYVKSRYIFIKDSETQNYMKQAKRFKEDKNMPAYIEALENASMFSPEDTRMKIEIADFYDSQKQYDKAAAQYEEALEKLPENNDLMFKLADVYEKNKKFDSAILIYSKLQEINPTDQKIAQKIQDLKVKFSESRMPEKFRNIFFKKSFNREDFAALIGFYFEKYLKNTSPLIITDIAGSFAREYIIRVCGANIMQLRPDHSFDRFVTINRASFAVTTYALLKYLETSGKNDPKGYAVQFTPAGKSIEPSDISNLHRDHHAIKFLLNAGIMKLDTRNNFNPTQEMPPSEALLSLQKILNSIRSEKEK